MKNLISPSTLGSELAISSDVIKAFQVKPTPFAEIVGFLNSNPQFSVKSIGSAIGVSPGRIYQWKCDEKKRSMSSQGKSSYLEVAARCASKKQARYTAPEKLELLRQYNGSKASGKTEILRKYGLYQTDMDRWHEKVTAAGLEALSKRKIRNDKKSPEQLKIEQLEKELMVQEKTTAKLTTIVLIQKKLKNILEIDPSV